MASQRLPTPSDWDSVKDQVLQFIAIVIVAAMVAFSGITLVEWQKQRSLPFCDSYDIRAENCIACPENGICHSGDLQCSPGYTRHGKACVKDQEMRKSVQEIEKYIVHQVCGHYSFPVCKWTGPEQLTTEEVALLAQQSGLDQDLGIDPAKWPVYIQEGLKTAEKQLLRSYSNRGVVLKCPVKLKQQYKPYSCCIKDWIISNCIVIIAALPVVALIVKFTIRAYRKRKTLKRATQLYAQVCETLEEMVELKSTGKESWIVASHLRDHLLTPAERSDRSLWLMVEQMVNRDSRIDQYPKLVKGESKVVWEWQVEGALKSPLSKIPR